MVKYIDYIISIEYSYDMNIRTLEYILAVYETGHFAKAAEKCNVSQPSLSIQIKKFEEQYGIKLFERDNKIISEAEVRLVTINKQGKPIQIPKVLEVKFKEYLSN